MIKQIGMLIALIMVSGCAKESPTTSITQTISIIQKPAYETLEHLSSMKALRDGKSTIEAISAGHREARAQRVRCNNNFSHDESFGDDNPNGKGYKYCQEMRNLFLDKGVNINLVDDFMDYVLGMSYPSVACDAWADQTKVDFAYGLIALSKSLNVDNSQFLDFVQDAISLFYKGSLNKNAGKLNVNKTIKFLNTLPKSEANNVIVILEAFSLNKISDEFGRKPDNVITPSQIILLKKNLSSRIKDREMNNYGRYGALGSSLVYKR